MRVYAILTICLCMWIIDVYGDTTASVNSNRFGAGRRLRCRFRCQRENPPAECDCANRLSCDTTQCAEGEVCQMVRSFARCLKDTAVCDLPKETTACEDTRPSFYYNKDTTMCEQFTTGECSSNMNTFSRRGQCIVTCRISRGLGRPEGRGRGRFQGRRGQGPRPGGRRGERRGGRRNGLGGQRQRPGSLRRFRQNP